MEATTLRPSKGKTLANAEKQSATDLMTELSEAIGNSPKRLGLVRALITGFEASREEDDREARVLAALMPSASTLSEAAVIQLQWNAAARAEALSEFGALTSAQLAQLRGSQTTNPHTTSTRWRLSGQLFSVGTAEGQRFPAFQVEYDGKPRPVIARVIKAMDSQLDGWGLLLWFTGSSAFLEGRRPVDLLEAEPDEVVAAAEYQSSLSED